MDIALTQIAGTSNYDWLLNPDGTDLAQETGLYSAILMSLGTDALANPDDILPAGDGDRRGTWMDDPVDGQFGVSQSAASGGAPADRMGSRLWLLTRVKASQQTLNDAIFYVEEALAWMVTDQVAGQVDVTGQYQPGNAGVIVLTIVIARLSAPGAKPATERYQALWENSTGALTLNSN